MSRRTRPGPSRRTRPVLGALAVATLAISACESDPSPRRVAEDLINTLAENDTVRDCMLDKLDDYSNDELSTIGRDFREGDQAAQAEAQAALAKFEQDLASCRD